MSTILNKTIYNILFYGVVLVLPFVAGCIATKAEASEPCPNPAHIRNVHDRFCSETGLTEIHYKEKMMEKSALEMEKLRLENDKLRAEKNKISEPTYSVAPFSDVTIVRNSATATSTVEGVVLP